MSTINVIFKQVVKEIRYRFIFSGTYLVRELISIGIVINRLAI